MSEVEHEEIRQLRWIEESLKNTHDGILDPQTLLSHEDIMDRMHWCITRLEAKLVYSSDELENGEHIIAYFLEVWTVSNLSFHFDMPEFSIERIIRRAFWRKRGAP